VYEFLDNIVFFNSDLLAAIDVEPKPPPGVGPVIQTVLRWTKWLAGACGVGGFFVIAIMMMIGRRNRSQMAADGMSALPWVCGGFLLIGLSSGMAEKLIETGEKAEVVFEDTASGSNLDSVTPKTYGEPETLDDFFG